MKPEKATSIWFPIITPHYFQGVMIFEKSQKSADQDLLVKMDRLSREGGWGALLIKVLFLKKHVTFFFFFFCYSKNEEIALLHEFIFVFTWVCFCVFWYFNRVTLSEKSCQKRRIQKNIEIDGGGGGSHIGELYTAGASNLLHAMVYS